jgi:hypothetical protein
MAMSEREEHRDHHNNARGEHARTWPALRSALVRKCAAEGTKLLELNMHPYHPSRPTLSRYPRARVCPICGGTIEVEDLCWTYKVKATKREARDHGIGWKIQRRYAHDDCARKLVVEVGEA